MLTPAALDRVCFLGAHMSTSGGLEKAVHRAKEIGATALQLFSKNQRQWKVPELTVAEITDFQGAWKEWGEYPVFIHDSYLINLAAVNEQTLARSIDGFALELVRAGQLGIPHLVTHPGSHLGQGVEKGLGKFTRNMDQALEAADVDTVTVLLEITAGQGTNLGSSLEQIRRIMDLTRFPERMGFCFDTCHGFAAGYELRTKLGYEQSMREIDRVIGFERLKLFHVNDSKGEHGSRKDRHEHIGQGAIGLEGFSLLMNDERFSRVPKILETPKDKDLHQDRENMDRLLRLLA